VVCLLSGRLPHNHRVSAEAGQVRLLDLAGHRVPWYQLGFQLTMVGGRVGQLTDVLKCLFSWYRATFDFVAYMFYRLSKQRAPAR